MGKIYPAISPEISTWINRQHMFFVATAPLASEHHINVSPKGMNTFRILDEKTVCYFDYTGSGAETIAHIRENKRITIMFCAFDGPPKIIRLHGTGEILKHAHKDWERLAALFNIPEPPRAIIRANISRISDSCGFGVPQMDYKSDRDSFTNWAAGKTTEDLANYRRTKNAKSIDGLPAWEEP